MKDPALRLALLFVSILSLFVLDSITPLGFVVWILYLVPLWFASGLGSRSIPPVFVVAGVCTVLIGLGYFYSAPASFSSSQWLQIGNRLIGVAVLWIMATLLYQTIRTSDAYQLAANIIESTDDAVIGEDLKGTIVSWNRGAERMFGYSADEAIGRPIALIIPDERKEEMPRLLNEIRHGHRLAHYETQRVRKDGRLIDISLTISPIKSADGRITGASKIARDITERKRTEEALRVSEARFRNLADSAPVLIWISGPDTLCTWLNKPWLEFRGRTLEEEWGNGWVEGIHPDDQEGCLQTYLTSFNARQPFHMEYRLKRHDGEYRWIFDHAIPLYGAGGEFAGYIGSCIDISERKVAEQELRNKQAQLVQAAKLASVGELATGVAHEINNPLNNIGLYLGNVLDYLDHGRATEAAIRSHVEKAMEQVRKAATIVGHLRTFGRAAPLERERMPINTVIISALSLMREQLRLHNIEVTSHLAPDNPAVIGNRIQLEQVVLNLLTNARDAVHAASRKTIVVTSAVKPPFVEITVRDSGIGIPADQQSRIFDPFFTTKDVGAGTGLGLSISYGIIKEHDGTILVESQPQEGTAFIIRLPLAAEAKPPSLSLAEANPIHRTEIPAAGLNG